LFACVVVLPHYVVNKDEYIYIKIYTHHASGVDYAEHGIVRRTDGRTSERTDRQTAGRRWRVSPKTAIKANHSSFVADKRLS